MIGSRKNVRSKKIKAVDPHDDVHKALANAPYPKDIVDDYSRIATTLKSAEILDKHLSKLNDVLEERLRAEGKLYDDEDGDITFVKKPGQGYTSHYHVLTKFIDEWSRKNGFNTTNIVSCIEINENGEKQRVEVELPAKLPVIFGHLPDSLFNALLAHGYLPKDLGSGVAHGEFTHFLQIYSIVEENKENQFLVNDPVQLYKMASIFHNLKKHTTPWELMFDYISTTDDNFRNPYFLNVTINDAKKQRDYSTKLDLDIANYPVLVQLLKGRSDKREKDYRPNPSTYFFMNPHLKFNTKQKYLNKNGIIMNDAIFFPIEGMNNSRKLIYDDISLELDVLKTQMQDALPIQFSENKNLNLLDNLINIFSKETYERNNPGVTIDQELEEHLNTIVQNLIEIKQSSEQPGETLSYLQVFNLLMAKYTLDDQPDDSIKQYYKSLMNIALNMLDKSQAKLEETHTFISTFSKPSP